MIRNSSSSCKNCMVLIRLIVLECLTWNVRLFCKHVRTEDNYFADALSRGSDGPVLEGKQGKRKGVFNNYPDQIPYQLTDLNSLWFH